MSGCLRDVLLPLAELPICLTADQNAGWRRSTRWSTLVADDYQLLCISLCDKEGRYEHVLLGGRDASLEFAGPSLGDVVAEGGR